MSTKLQLRIIELESVMRKFINFELPDCVAREEMRIILNEGKIPGPGTEEHVTNGDDCWCDPDKVKP